MPAMPRQIGRQILGDPVGEILLLPVVAEIGKGQHDNRQPWRCAGTPMLGPALAVLGAGHASAAARRSRGSTRSPGRQSGSRARRPSGCSCLPARSVIENAAQRRDLHVEIAVFDRRSRPDGFDDLVSRYEFPRPLDQHAENCRSARQPIAIAARKRRARRAETEHRRAGRNGSRRTRQHQSRKVRSSPRLPRATSISQHFSTIYELLSRSHSAPAVAQGLIRSRAEPDISACKMESDR